MRYIKFIPFVFLLFLVGCESGSTSDAFGNFEATTVTVSAKGTGELISFDIQEGERYEMGELLGLIDTTQLHLEKLLVQAQLQTIEQKTINVAPDIRVLEERKSNLERELRRTKALKEDNAATQKQLDDYEGEIELIVEQIQSLKENAKTTNRGILAEQNPLNVQLQIINQKIKDHVLVSPIRGTILTKLKEESEFVNMGTPLYTIANLEELKLKAYTTAELLQQATLNDEVTVLIDEGEDSYRELSGRLVWIASEAEFTPENIQTKEERVGLVYAIEVAVENDGSLKIGMPGEVKFKGSEN